MKKIVCAAAAAACVAAVGFGFSALHGELQAQAGEVQDVVGTKRYIIANPYSAVNWDTWGQYKSATHVHSMISDGDYQFADQIENYYRLGFDAVAMTDHGAVNRGWTVDKTSNSERPVWFNYQAITNGTGGLTKNMKSLTAQRNLEITTGVGRNGRPMIDIPLGIELNGASTKKCHVNGFFADAGQNDMELNAKGIDGCVTAVTKNARAGGITHINHVGEFMEANDCSTAAEAMSSVYTSSWINEFADRVFRTYPSCIGMELVNKSDNRTKWDRHLYDELLKRLAPEGRGLWGFCGDDSHHEDELDQNCAWFITPELKADKIRTSMETGCFFVSSRRSKEELSDATGNGDYPRISRLTVDEARSQIILHTTKAQKAVMIADGNELEIVNCNPSGTVVTFDLNRFEAQINSYVRLYLTGEGGITYVQPFYVTTTEYNTTASVSFNVFLNNEQIYSPTVTIRNSLGTIVPMSSRTYIELPTPDTYTYEVSAPGSTTATGSFVITTDDFVMGNSYTLTINLECVPELIPNTQLNNCFDATTHTITGLTVGEDVTANIASSSNSLGAIQVVPTSFGYGTGTKVNLVYDGEVIDSYTCIIYGDTNGDTLVDATDCLRLQAYLTTAMGYEIADAPLRASDVNNDGTYDMKDIELLRGIGMGDAYTINQNR
ncbi:MAG: hypothetical protein IJT44_06700 [Clostridia bacterium]|nr:hypothetical protein [Clostridia bacterium]